MNYAHWKGMIWGRDIGFTYGPWAFLSIGMNVGKNLDSAIAVQSIAWMMGIPVLLYLLIKRAPQLLSCVLFLSSLDFSYSALHHFGYVGLDHYLCLMVLLLLASALFSKYWQIPFGAAIAVAAFAAMIMFSAGVFSLSAVVLFGLAARLYDRARAGLCLLLTSIAFTAVFCIFFLLHHPSIDSMLGFIRTSMERSDAYNISNSLPSSPQDLHSALILFSIYAAFSVTLFVCRDRAAYFSVVLLAPWFFVFKHGFVRSDSHVGIYFTMCGAFMGILLLVTGFQKRHWWKYAAPQALLVLLGVSTSSLQTIVQWHASFAEVRQQFVGKLRVFRPGFATSLDADSAAALARDRLPAGLLARIGDSRVTAFPWELSYGSANHLNLIPMPMLQSYGADSAWLDRWNSRLFAQFEPRPEFLLMDWQAIDGRHVLLDAPSTALEIYRWYGIEQRAGDRLLSRKRSSARFAGVRPLRKADAGIGELIEVPVSNHPVTGRLRMNLSFHGRVVKFFWKIPEVQLALLSGDGRSWIHRIIPDVLSNQGLLNALPFSLDQMEKLLANNHIDHSVKQLLVTGLGARFYQPEIEAEFFEIPEVTLTEAQSEVAKYESMPAGQSIDSWRIDMVNDIDASFLGQIAVPESARYVRLTGWAVDPVSGDCAVAVEIDGKRNTQAIYGIPRADVPLILKDPKCTTSGFEWSLPLSKGEHSLRLRILSSNRNVWYTADRSISISVPGLP